MSKTTVVMERSLLRGRRGRRGRWHSEPFSEPCEDGLHRLGVLAEHGEVVRGAREEEDSLRPLRRRLELPRGIGAARISLARKQKNRPRDGRDGAGEGGDPRLVQGNSDGRVHLSPLCGEKRDVASRRKAQRGCPWRAGLEPRGRRLDVARETVRVGEEARREREHGALPLRGLPVGPKVDRERREARGAELLRERLELAALAREIVDEEDARRLRVALDRTPGGCERDAVGRGNRDASGVCRARHRRGLGRFLLFLRGFGGPARQKRERSDRGDRAPEGGSESGHFGLKPLPSAKRTWSCTECG